MREAPTKVFIKVSNGFERFWLIKSATGRGVVDNRTIDSRSPRYGEEIDYAAKDVRDVLLVYGSGDDARLVRGGMTDV